MSGEYTQYPARWPLIFPIFGHKNQFAEEEIAFSEIFLEFLITFEND
jgi:hypothetical protein